MSYPFFPGFWYSTHLAKRLNKRSVHNPTGRRKRPPPVVCADLLLYQAVDHSANEHEAGLVSCSDHGSDALMWAAGRGDSEHALLEELIKLSGGACINRESHHGDTALTMACSR